MRAKTLITINAEKNILQSEVKPDQPIIIALGPEGGWVPFEIELITELGFEPTILGPWTLRVENALVAAISQLSLIN